jgi:hypothetical protein
MDILRREYSDLRIFRARDILSYGHSDLRTVYSYGYFELLSAVHRVYSELGIFSQKPTYYSLRIFRVWATWCLLFSSLWSVSPRIGFSGVLSLKLLTYI